MREVYAAHALLPCTSLLNRATLHASHYRPKPKGMQPVAWCSHPIAPGSRWPLGGALTRLPLGADGPWEALSPDGPWEVLVADAVSVPAVDLDALLRPQRDA